MQPSPFVFIRIEMLFCLVQLPLLRGSGSPTAVRDSRACLFSFAPITSSARPFCGFLPWLFVVTHDGICHTNLSGPIGLLNSCIDQAQLASVPIVFSCDL
jgi:hypothetical protein